MMVLANKPGVEVDVERLLEDADAAMYREKRAVKESNHLVRSA